MINLAMVRLYCGESGKKGFYNMQEIGLAKQLKKNNINIYIILLNDKLKKIQEEIISSNITILHIPSWNIGNHGFFNCDVLLKYSIKIVQLQSDNQIYAPNVIKYCLKNNIFLYNYIGTICSDGNNILKKLIQEILFFRNAVYYRKVLNFTKNPTVQKQLNLKRINSTIAPVGLDTEIIPPIYESKEELRRKLNLPINKKIIIFVGRLEKYKEPNKAIELIQQLGDGYLLILIGKGSLRDDLLLRINNLKIDKDVIYYENVPNVKIHEYYKLSDYFVNYNSNEIFGMSILEAMYQGCTVIAKEAPGPQFILENGVSGFIVNNEDDFIDIIKKQKSLKNENIRKRVENFFAWNISSEIILNDIKKYDNFKE